MTSSRLPDPSSALRPPGAVTWIVRTLEKAGHETWAVGGSVRDALAGVASQDWDLATHARPGEMRKLFRRTVPIGIEHGTVGILARDGTLYEVTTFRQDVETTGRHATVRFAETLEEDLSRRDFTINAIAWHPLRNELRDPFGGAEDLGRKVLRTVGEPHERFEEDYLRILRALRFAGTYSLTIEDSTWTALCDGVRHMLILSAERIREELMKVLSKAPRPSVAMELYAGSGAIEVLYPELAACFGLTRSRVGSREAAGAHPATATRPADATGRPDALSPAARLSWTETLGIVDALAPSRPLLRLAALLREAGVAGSLALMERLRFSNAAIDEVAKLVSASEGRRLPLPPENTPPAEIRRWLSRVGPEQLPALTRLAIAGVRARCAPASPGARDDTRNEARELVRRWRRIREELRGGPPLTVDDLALDGKDLIRMGYKPGPRFGRVLRELLDEVIEQPEKNVRDVLADLARERIEGDA